MSGVKGENLGGGRCGYATRVVNNDVVRKATRLEIEAYEDVYYPVINMGSATTNSVDAQEEDRGRETPLTNLVKHKGWFNNEQSSVRKWCSRFANLLVVLVAAIAVVLVGLKMMGYRSFTVLSGSMEPEYPVGAMLYVKPINYQELKVGDVISYVASDDKTVVTHRIVKIEVDEADATVWRFKTKGDANKTADAKLVHYKNVLGTPTIIIPYIGYFVHNIQKPPGIYITLVVGTLLLAWTFLPSTLEERRKTARNSVV